MTITSSNNIEYFGYNVVPSSALSDAFTSYYSYIYLRNVLYRWLSGVTPPYTVSLPYSITVIAGGAFQGVNKANGYSISGSGVKTVCDYAFAYTTSGPSGLSLPICEYIGRYAFSRCLLRSVYLPMCKIVNDDAFVGCSQLSCVSLPNCEMISTYAFASCVRLTSLYLMGSSVVQTYSAAFSSTPIGGYSTSAGKYGTIYVPSSLYSAYINASAWSYFSARFSSI